MSTDYNLPSWFWDKDVTDEDRHIWFTQERCRRQALRQQLPTFKMLQEVLKREQRKAEARSDTVNLENYR